MRRLLLITTTLLLATASCRTVHKVPSVPRLPVNHSIVRGQLVFYSDFTIADNHRLLEQLQDQRSEIAVALGLPMTEEPIHVYLFRTPKTYKNFIERHHPNFPDRRAFFLETDAQLSIYAQWGDRMAEDLRHEVTHGYVHAAVREIPLWLDEGIAEYFEVPAGFHGTNQPHIVELLTAAEKEEWRPNIRRLESIESATEMNQRDYAEAWAWVHLLLEKDKQHRKLLQDYLRELRSSGVRVPISLTIRKIEDNPDEALLVHLRSLRDMKKSPDATLPQDAVPAETMQQTPEQALPEEPA